MGLHTSYTFDKLLELKDAGLESSSTNYTAVDLGVGYASSVAVIDVTAVESDTGDETYNFIITGSNDETFATDVHVLAVKALGFAVTPTSDDQYALGRYVAPFTNEENDTVFRYVRLQLVIGGTIVTGINAQVFIAQHLN